MLCSRETLNGLTGSLWYARDFLLNTLYTFILYTLFFVCLYTLFVYLFVYIVCCLYTLFACLLFVFLGSVAVRRRGGASPSFSPGAGKKTNCLRD